MPKSRKINKSSSKMDALLKSHPVDLRQFHSGELIEGIVVSSTHREVLIDVGAKSEGIISGFELVDEDNSYKNLKPGDTVLAIVLQAENDQGYIVLSLKRAEKDKKWQAVEAAFNDGSTFECEVIEYNKGGLLVGCAGLRGFVPLSHLDRVHFTEDVGKYASGSEVQLKESLDVLSGKVLKVKIIEVDRAKNRLVVSEKNALSTYTEEARSKR